MTDRSSHRLQRRGSRKSYQESTDPMVALLSLAAGRPVFTEREYTVVAGTVVDIFDLSDNTRTHVVTQPDTAKQVAPPLPHADFNGARCYTFTGAEVYVSNRPPSAWKYGHDGTGFERTAVYTPTATGNQRLWCTNGAEPGSVGSRSYASGSVSGQFLVVAGAGFAVSTGGTAPGAGTPFHLTTLYQEARAPAEWEVYGKRALIASGDSTAAPSSADPATPLTIGGRLNAGNWAGRLPCLVDSPALSSDARMAKWSAIETLYGVAA